MPRTINFNHALLAEQISDALHSEAMKDRILHCDDAELANSSLNEVTSRQRACSGGRRSWCFQFSGGCLQGDLRIEKQSDRYHSGLHYTCNLEMPTFRIDSENAENVMRGYFVFLTREGEEALVTLAHRIARGEFTTLGEVRIAYLEQVLSVEVPVKFNKIRPGDSAGNAEGRTSRTTRTRQSTIDRIARTWSCDRILGYHAHSRLSFVNNWCGDGSEPTIGFEHEINSQSTIAERATEIYNRHILGHVYYEHDGSITGDGGNGCRYCYGVECISQPHTWTEFKNLNLRQVWDELKAAGFEASDSRLCGLHTHISRNAFGEAYDDQKYNLRKIMKLMNSRRKEFMKLFGRGDAGYAHWPDRYATDEQIAEYVNDHPYGHSNGINFQHSHTYEFRFPNGTLDYGRYFAIVNTLLVMAKNSQQVEYGETDINKWFNGLEPEAIAYFNSREIFTDFSGNE